MKYLLCLMVVSYCLDSSGQNVGIGTPTPLKGKLEVVGVAGTGKTNAVFGAVTTGISLQQDWPTIGFNQYRDNAAGNGKYMSSGYAAIQFMDPNGGGMYFDMLGQGFADNTTGSGARALTLMPNGNVGIHSNGSSATLTVSRGTGIDGTARFEGTTNTSHFNYGTAENTYIRAGKDGGTVFINDVQNGVILLGPPFNGRVAIGATSPGVYPLFVYEVFDNDQNRGIILKSNAAYGTTFSWELVNLGFNFQFSFNDMPKAQISGNTGSYFTVSDRRLKENFEDLTGVLGKVMQLHPQQYNLKWDKENPVKNIGFIAQEVKEIFPSLVTVQQHSPRNLAYGNIPDLHMIDYSGFGVLAIKAIQEQETIIERQQQQIDELKKRLDKLEGK